MMPGSAMLDARERLKAVPENADVPVRRRRGRLRRMLGGRAFPWVLVLLVVASAAAGGIVLNRSADTRTSGLERQLAAARAELTTAVQRGDATGASVEALREKIHALQQELAQLRDATGSKQTTTTKTVTKWVPNADVVKVEVTGFEGMVQLRDVQLTHAYGYSDLIGIAVNTSGQTISYAQLGCTFVDADGKVIANEIDNKQNWLPEQTWGFDCSGQVRATGGILRVDELG